MAVDWCDLLEKAAEMRAVHGAGPYLEHRKERGGYWRVRLGGQSNPRLSDDQFIGQRWFEGRTIEEAVRRMAHELDLGQRQP